ncbi:MAG: aminotransferase class I/II-fold pyridoxal phosphate-dependent enzyme [Polyangiaceae bacterium]|nr:aminotransferase class I/II-fold pyridoxal phosphate-dependent enzyme [Polyangiaceae bacterium]
MPSLPDLRLSFLDRRVRGLTASSTLAIQERSRALIAQGKRVYRLGLGQSPFPVPETVVDALKANAAEKDYLPVRGLPELREAVAQYYRRREGLSRFGDDVLIGPGSKELMFLLQVCFDGELLVPTPAWVSYEPQARIAGRRVRLLPTVPEAGFRLSVRTLEEVVRPESGVPRVLILNYPSNPTGLGYAPQELAELGEACRSMGLVVLSDEIYGELRFAGDHVSIARYYPEGTIVSSGLSKWCGAGGWRLGTFTYPEELRWLLDAMAAVASETYSTTSAPIQYAAVRAFRGGAEIESYLVRVRGILSELTRFAAARLSEAGASTPRPEGAFYVFSDFSPRRAQLAGRGISDDVELCDRLLGDTGVAALPGREFGMPRDSLFVRFALVNFDGSRALAVARGREVDASFVRELARPTVEAIEAVAAWLD